MPNIELTLVNHSNDQNNSEIVIFQKNVETSFNELAVAWRVIQNLGRNDYHPFTYPSRSYGAASDSYGNYTPQTPVENGQQYAMVKDLSGDVFKHIGPGGSPNAVEIANNLQQGAINALIYKDGKLLATKQNIAPAQKAVFEFKPNLFIGVVSQVEEGQVMNSAIISQVNTELSLLGMASADIIMTGGGSGRDATPFEFNLENIVLA